MHVGEWQIDLQANRIQKGARSKHLEPLVMRLLSYFIERPGDVITRTKLLNEVWADKIVEDDALSRAVIKLRKALGDSAKDPAYIETVPKVGYRLVASVHGPRATQRLTDSSILSWKANANGESQTIDTSMLSGANGPAVAVLPLWNASQDPHQDYFSDGLSDDIITALSASRSFLVLASGATFAYRGRDVDPTAAGRALGAKYVLRGGVERHGDRLRVRVELYSTDTPVQLWSAKYDQNTDDIFAIQDDITANVAAAVEPEIEAQEARRVLASRPHNLTSYDLTQRGLWHLQKRTLEDWRHACPLFNQVLDSDERYARAYAGLTNAKFQAAMRLWEDRQTALGDAIRFGRIALDLDPVDPRVLRFYGGAMAATGNHDEALWALQRAITLHPSHASSYSALAFLFVLVGEFSAALTAMQTTRRLRPGDRSLNVCMSSEALAQYAMEDYELAESICRESLRTDENWWLGNLVLIAAQGQQERLEDIGAPLARLQSSLPSLTVAALSELLPFREPKHREHLIEGLQRAGWRPTDC